MKCRDHCRYWLQHYTRCNNSPCWTYMCNGSFLSTSYMHVCCRRTVTTGPLGFTKLQRSCPEQLSHVDDIRHCAGHCTVLLMSCCMLACRNYAVCLSTVSRCYLSNEQIIMIGGFVLFCAHLWRVDCVMRCMCDELTGDELTGSPLSLLLLGNKVLLASFSMTVHGDNQT